MPKNPQEDRPSMALEIGGKGGGSASLRENPNLPRLDGKSISEWLGQVLKQTNSGTGLPSRLRVTAFDPKSGNVRLYGTRQAKGAPKGDGQPFDIGHEDLQQLMTEGHLKPDVPAYAKEGASSSAVRRQLQRTLDTGARTKK